MVSSDVFDAIVTRTAEQGLPVAAHVPLTVPASSAGPRVDSMEHLRNLELGCAADADALLAERRRPLADIPLEAIENTREIVAVMSGGAWVSGVPRARPQPTELREGSGSGPSR